MKKTKMSKKRRIGYVILSLILPLLLTVVVANNVGILGGSTGSSEVDVTIQKLQEKLEIERLRNEAFELAPVIAVVRNAQRGHVDGTCF